MQAILAVTIPFFALVLCGHAAARWQLLPESAVPGLNAFVLFFALPCMLFRFGASTPLLDLLNPVVLGLYAGVALCIVGLTVPFTRRWPRTPRLPPLSGRDAAFGALVAAFPNSGFMGVPLLVALLGPAAAGPVICTLLADLFFTSSLCLALAQWHPEDPGAAASRGVRQALLRALRGACANPLPWAIAAGAATARMGLVLPGPLRTLVGMLADAATPVALFTIGAVLWRSGRHAAHRTPLAAYLPVAVIKLFVHPLLVLALGAAARALGAPLSAFQLTVLTLAAALPSASNVSLLAERYGADNGRIARIIMSSTVGAFASFTLLAWAFGVQPR